MVIAQNISVGKHFLFIKNDFENEDVIHPILTSAIQ